MACFADINVLQGSVATYARSGGIFNIQLGPNYKFTRNSSSEKNYFQSVQIWQNCGHGRVKCLHGLAPKYLAELCVPVAHVAGRRQLLSASRGLLNFPRYNTSTMVDVRSVSPVLTSGTHFLSISGNQHQ